MVTLHKRETPERQQAVQTKKNKQPKNNKHCDGDVCQKHEGLLRSRFITAVTLLTQNWYYGTKKSSSRVHIISPTEVPQHITVLLVNVRMPPYTDTHTNFTEKKK